MAAYRYNPNPAPGRRPQKSNSDTWYWIISLILIFTGIATPVGILMIVFKLLGDDKKKAAQRQEDMPLGARTFTQGSAVRQGGSHPNQLDAMAKKGKRLTILGGILTGLFTFVTLVSLSEAAHWLISGEVRWFWEELVSLTPMLCFVGGGVGCLWAGIRKSRRARTYQKYLNMIGIRASIPISSLASAAGASPAQVRQTLEDMLDHDLFPNGFLDYGSDQFILSGGGLREEPASKESEPAADDAENTVLAEIRAISDDIDNPRLSAQIDRIGIITAKIFDYQKSHPERSPQLHSFLSYYLPTTLKILRAYAQLEDQQVSGSNITAAMARIEAMMDKVVDGFEKQLDQLFQGDTMDITADVEVLERMLAKDGLSGQGQTEFQLKL